MADVDTRGLTGYQLALHQATLRAAEQKNMYKELEELRMMILNLSIEMARMKRRMAADVGRM